MRQNAGRDIRLLRTGTVLLGFTLVLMVLVSNSPAANAASGDRAADRVLGQPTFYTRQPNQGLITATASTLYWPYNVSVDRSSGRLFVADRHNWRVQSWPHATSFTNGAAADLSITEGAGGLLPDPVSTATDSSGNLYVAELVYNRVLVYAPPYTATGPSYVIGQQDMTSTFSNQGLGYPTARTLKGPYSVATDASGHLFVADLMNSRVLRYALPITANNKAADLVLGEADFGSAPVECGYIHGTPGANNRLCKPQGMAVGSDGSVYVSDSDNNRVLKFAMPLSNGMAATLVLGQPNFVSNSPNQGRGSSYPTAQTLNIPSGIAVDQLGRIYVTDWGNYRVVGYRPTGDAAFLLVGQPDFDSPAFGPSPPSEYSVGYPASVAVDNAMNVYIADRDNNRILRFDLPFWGWDVQLPLIIK